MYPPPFFGERFGWGLRPNSAEGLSRSPHCRSLGRAAALAETIIVS